MQLDEILQQRAAISFAAVREFLASGDLTIRARILDYAYRYGNRITPEPDEEWLRDELYRLNVECIKSDRSNDHVPSPIEAASGLVRLFEWLLAGNGGGSVAAERMIQEVTAFFRESNAGVRNCIETGFLEHVLEIPQARPFFDHWKQDADLADSYHAAMEWGVAHERRNASLKRR